MRNGSFGVSRLLVLGAAAVLYVTSARAAGVPIPHGTVELIAEDQWVAPGHTIRMGIHFQLEQGWHIYWVNPGDSGEPPRVQWQLPAGLTAGDMQWPTPRRLGTATIVDFGYEDTVMLVVPIHAKPRMDVQAPVEIGAEVKVLVCREMCIPGKAQVSLTVPMKAQAPLPDAQFEDLFVATRKTLPHPAPGDWKFSVTDAKDSLLLEAIVGPESRGAYFFPLVEAQINDAAPQQYVAETRGFRLTLKKSDQLLKPIERLKGVLVFAGNRGFVIDVPVDKAAAQHNDGSRAVFVAAVPMPPSVIATRQMAHQSALLQRPGFNFVAASFSWALLRELSREAILK